MTCSTVMVYVDAADGPERRLRLAAGVAILANSCLRTSIREVADLSAIAFAAAIDLHQCRAHRIIADTTTAGRLFVRGRKLVGIIARPGRLGGSTSRPSARPPRSQNWMRPSKALLT
jgi:hypothetical protein